MKRLYIALCLILSLLLAPGCGQPTTVAQQQSVTQPAANPTASNLTSAQVVRVVDGDTLAVNIAGTEQRVRLILVDTPESVHPDKTKTRSTASWPARLPPRNSKKAKRFIYRRTYLRRTNTAGYFVTPG